MTKDQGIGALLMTVSIVVMILYTWLVFFPHYPSGLLPSGIDIVVLKLTGAVAVVALFAILAWIGYTLATTPPPKPIEEIEKELEKEVEKKTEEAQPPTTEVAKT